MTKLEEIARAICSIDGENSDETIGSWVGNDFTYLPRWHFTLPEARAAVEAMEEMTHEMEQAGCNTLGHMGVPLKPGQARHCFRAILDAILTEHDEVIPDAGKNPPSEKAEAL